MQVRLSAEAQQEILHELNDLSTRLDAFDKALDQVGIAGEGDLAEVAFAIDRLSSVLVIGFQALIVAAGHNVARAIAEDLREGLNDE